MPLAASMVTVKAVVCRFDDPRGCISSCKWSQISPSRARQSSPRHSRSRKLTCSGVTSLGGNEDVPLVLAVRIVHHDDYPAGTQLVNELWNRREGHLGGSLRVKEWMVATRVWFLKKRTSWPRYHGHRDA